MKYYFQKNYPVIATLLILAGLLLITSQQILSQTGGHYCYPLDDTFIHMSIAKNFALHGMWGINAQEYSAASSSPLYTIILAALFKIGINSIWMPFYVNVFFAMLLIITTDKLLQHFRMIASARFVTLLLIILLVPVTVMVASGMEHLLHGFLAMLLLYRSVIFLQDENINSKQVLLTALVAGLSIVARFESLFLLAGIIAIGIYNRKWLPAGLLLLLSLVPLVVFGCISMRHGGYFLPNSVLLKGSHLGGSIEQFKSSLQEIIVYKLIFGNNTMVNIFTNRYYPEGSSSLSGTTLVRLLMIIPALILLAKPGKQISQLACIPLVATFLHLALASVGWLFRYEAYLVAMDLAVIALLCNVYIKQLALKFRLYTLLEKLIFLFLVLFVLSPLPMRALGAYHNLPLASRNIYEQQYQMGTFLHQHYEHTAVAANDIGAISYLSDNTIIDLWGLGSNVVANSKLKGYYTPDFLNKFSNQQQVKIAIVYDSWFDSTLLNNWKKIAVWKISNNVICGSDEVSFYAVDPAAADTLRENLKAFRHHLPADVLITEQ
jgi:hypothetical protein